MHHSREQIEMVCLKFTRNLHGINKLTKRIYGIEKKSNPFLKRHSVHLENHRIDDEIASQAHRTMIPKKISHVKWKPGPGYSKLPQLYGKIWRIVPDLFSKIY